MVLSLVFAFWLVAVVFVGPVERTDRVAGALSGSAGGKPLSLKRFEEAEEKPASSGAPFVGFGEGGTFSDFKGAACELFEKATCQPGELGFGRAEGC